MSSGSTPSGLVFSVPSVLILDSASFSWCSLPARRATSKSNRCSLNRHLVNFHKTSADVINHFKSSWSARILTLLGPRYGRNRFTTHTAAMYSFCVVASFCSALVSVREQYPIGSALPPSCCCSSTHSTGEPYASM